MAFCKYTPCTAKLFGTSHFTDRPHGGDNNWRHTHHWPKSPRVVNLHIKRKLIQGVWKTKKYIDTYIHICIWVSRCMATVSASLIAPGVTWISLACMYAMQGLNFTCQDLEHGSYYICVFSFFTVMNKKRLCWTKTCGISASRQWKKEKRKEMVSLRSTRSHIEKNGTTARSNWSFVNYYKDFSDEMPVSSQTVLMALYY